MQFYGINEGTQPLMFGDPGAGKFGSYFVKDGKVRLIWHACLIRHLTPHPLQHAACLIPGGHPGKFGSYFAKDGKVRTVLACMLDTARQASSPAACSMPSNLLQGLFWYTHSTDRRVARHAPNIIQMFAPFRTRPV